MKTITITFFTTMTSGYGHRKVTIMTNDNQTLSATTSNMPLTDMLQSDDDAEVEEAKKDLSEMVLRDNNIEFENVIVQ